MKEYTHYNRIKSVLAEKNKTGTWLSEFGRHCPPNWSGVELSLVMLAYWNIINGSSQKRTNIIR